MVEGVEMGERRIARSKFSLFHHSIFPFSQMKTPLMVLAFFISCLVFPLDSYSKGGGHGGGGHGGGRGSGSRGSGHHGSHHGGHHGGGGVHGGSGNYYYGYFPAAFIGYGYGVYAYRNGCTSCHPRPTGERCKYLEHNAMIDEYLRDEKNGLNWRLRYITP